MGYNQRGAAQRKLDQAVHLLGNARKHVLEVAKLYHDNGYDKVSVPLLQWDTACDTLIALLRRIQNEF